MLISTCKKYFAIKSTLNLTPATAMTTLSDESTSATCPNPTMIRAWLSETVQALLLAGCVLTIIYNKKPQMSSALGLILFQIVTKNKNKCQSNTNIN